MAYKDVSVAVKAIQDAGFSHIKVELEATLQRFVTRHGVDFTSERNCQKFISDHISEHARNAINYMQFYYDHSVDSELTFTLPVSEIDVVIEVINAWNSLAKEIGNGCDVAGAGMHISVLTGPNYPTYETLPTTNITNFMNEVSKLLPALFIAATSGDFTRGLRFREPQISPYTKYSAIYTHENTCLEYRLFETCYQRPEAIYEFLGVIAKTLEFYTDPNKKIAKMNKVFEVYEAKGLNGYMTLPEQVQILKAQIKHIKPDGMTVKEFLDARGVTLLVKTARDKQGKKILRLKIAYEEQKKAHEKIRKDPLNEWQWDNLKYWKEQEPGHPESWYWERVTGHKAKIESQASFINTNLKSGTRAIASMKV